MGTPLATRVPRVRVVRATMFFSTNWPKIGIFRMNMSQPMRPAGNLRISLMNSQMADGNAGQQIPVVDDEVRDVDQDHGHRRQVGVEVLEDLLERGHDLHHDEDQDAARRR